MTDIPVNPPFITLTSNMHAGGTVEASAFAIVWLQQAGNGNIGTHLMLASGEQWHVTEAVADVRAAIQAALPLPGGGVTASSARDPAKVATRPASLAARLAETHKRLDR